jgi:hypothetical protein
VVMKLRRQLPMKFYNGILAADKLYSGLLTKKGDLNKIIL